MTTTTMRRRIPLREQVAEEIRALLARRRMSASELARRMEVNQAYISRRLTGVTAFDLDDLQMIAEILDVPVTALLPRSDKGANLHYAPVLALSRPGGRSHPRKRSDLAHPATVATAA